MTRLRRLFKLKPGLYKTLGEGYRFAPKASRRPSIVKSSGEWPFEAQGKRVASGEEGGKWTARTPEAHSQEWLCHWAQGRG